MIGRVIVTDVMKMNIPKPQTLGSLRGRGALSGDVIALDSQSVMIKDLIFGGNQPGKQFFQINSHFVRLVIFCCNNFIVRSF